MPSNSQPLVSACVATFNGKGTVGTAITSLLEQTYENIEIIVVDDDSVDGTQETIAEFAQRDKRIRFFENDVRLGLTGNMNRCVSHAQGDFIFWCDQDDWRSSTFVESCLKTLDQYPESVMCVTDVDVVWPQLPGRTIHINHASRALASKHPVVRYRSLLESYFDTYVLGAVRRSAFERTLGWQACNSSANLLLFELILQGPFSVIPESLATYTAKGAGRRPTAEGEWMRQNPGRGRRKQRLPHSLVQAARQLRAVIACDLPYSDKLRISSSIVWRGGVGLIARGLLRMRFGSRFLISAPKRRFALQQSANDLSGVEFNYEPREIPGYLPEGFVIRRERKYLVF